MFKKSIKNKIRKYVETNYIRINPDDIELGEINYTFRCHLNAVQKVKEGKAEKVFSCIAIDVDSGWICVHFINQTKEGKYVDHTWGWTKEHYNYYLIREIDRYEQYNIGSILTKTRDSLIELHTNWFQRLFIIKSKMI